MNLYESITKKSSSKLNEASIFDYIDADALPGILASNPILGGLEFVRELDGMIIEMKGAMGNTYYKVVKGPNNGLEAYWISKTGEKLGDAFPLINEVDENDSSEDKYIVWQFGGMISDPHDLEDKIFDSKEEATEALKAWKNSYGSNKSYYRPSGNVYKYKGKTPKETREEQAMTESVDDLDAGDDITKFTDDELIEKYYELKSDVDYNDETGQWDSSYEDFFKICSELDKRGISLDEATNNHIYKCTVYTHGEPNVLRGKTIEDCYVREVKSIHQLSKLKDAEDLTEGTKLRGSVFTEIVNMIDDACAEEMDELEIQKFLKELMIHLRGTAESYNLKIEAESEGESLTEAPNPANAKANSLIKSALSDAFFAYKHRDKLQKLGITVDYKLWKSRGENAVPKSIEDFERCHLVGTNGRVLQCQTSSWDTGQIPDSTEITNSQNGNHGEDYYNSTIAKKTYKDSRETVSKAKAEMPTLKRRLGLYERRYGKDSSQYRELVRYIKDQQKIIDDGIKARRIMTYSSRPHADVDYKNYLDAPKQEDRVKPYEPPKMNPTVAAYKGAKAEEQYQAREEQRNKKYDEEDTRRIADMARRAADEKLRRDTYLATEKAKTQATLKSIRDRIAASKARRGE